MKSYESETTADRKYYIYFETDADGTRLYRSASTEDRVGTTLTEMRVEGKPVPAIKLEVTKEIYDIFKREQWMNEYRYRQENRCIISTPDGRTRFCPCRIPNPAYKEGSSLKQTLTNDCSRCPYDRLFRPIKGKLLFSTLAYTND